MDETIARLNIERFQQMLKDEKDESKRQTLLYLLGEEKAKLSSLKHQANKQE